MTMRSREYWQERFEELEQARNDFAEDIFCDISKEYDRAIQRLDNELSYWYQRYAFDNEISYQEAKKSLNSKELKQFKLTVKTFIDKAKETDLSEEWQKRLENAYLRMRISRIEAIQLMLQQHLEVLFGNQLDQLDKKLKELYTEDYNHTVFNIQQGAGIGSSFIGVDTNKLDTVLSKPWADDGKNFSSRIWEHKSNLVTLLNKELLQAVIRGDDYQTATNNIAHKMNVSRANAGRLVMTEAAFIGTRAQKDCFTNLGVEEYEFVATLDRRTSPICRSMDGKHFKMSDMKIGTNAPPLHPRCRSCTAPYFEDADDLERIARGENGDTYRVPGDMTYEQWRKNLLHSDGKNVIINEKSTHQSGAESGALNDGNDPDRAKRDAHAQREYTRIRKNGKDVFVDKISTNTGMRKKFLANVYDHVFVNKHILIDGVRTFDADYDMAVSFQRLKEGNYKDVDVVLLRHEHLEMALEKRFNLTYKQAHDYAVKHFDYGKAIKGEAEIANGTFRTNAK